MELVGLWIRKRPKQMLHSQLRKKKVTRDHFSEKPRLKQKKNKKIKSNIFRHIFPCDGELAEKQH